MLNTIADRFRSIAPAVDAWSLRVAHETHDHLTVLNDVLQPPLIVDDLGAMITVRCGRGEGYAATSNLTEGGLRAAVERARRWAEQSAERGLIAFDVAPLSAERGEYAGPVERPWGDVPLDERVGLLREAAAAFRGEPAFARWTSGVWATTLESLLVTSEGGSLHQQGHFLTPMLRVIATDGADTIFRSMGRSQSRQGGLEVLHQTGFMEAGARIAREARELLEAPQCPSGAMDVVLSADQMVLQIHESIGHPLEIDRILGDERNFAGTSFVTPDMFGHYRYGSELLNITFDPNRPEQLASYRWDDDGALAERAYIIKDGVLERGLGGKLSQARSGLDGVAAARTCRWTRPTIDRMANLNLEPGDASLDALIGAVERGVYMESNLSWSIDDSRNKFQFGCEYGRLIEDGQLTKVVRKPNYRGVSASFWRNLKGVGDLSTFGVMGTPFCGKGEPNQVIRVGHATPACLFADVDVFGGA